MPTGTHFAFSVVVADIPLPEYVKDGVTYVESNLWTPASYRQRVREVAYGEIEEQEWPVTPYKLRISTKPCCPQSWFQVYIDGAQVHKRVLSGGQEWVCKGFADVEGTREFLFALPRFSRDEKDRLCQDRKSKVGTIEIIQKHATFTETRICTPQLQDTDFDQANKKDAFSITEGKHTMSTTKKGRLTEKTSSSSKPQTRKFYSYGPEIDRLLVQYHMAHSLKDMGITVQPVDWGQSQTATPTIKKQEGI